VQIKIKEIADKGEKKKLIQIIDVSHKILYDESKAAQHFLSLINATVSHELRNPLNSLIGQLLHMDVKF
jgi:signal transduction histidine kinase